MNHNLVLAIFQEWNALLGDNQWNLPGTDVRTQQHWFNEGTTPSSPAAKAVAVAFWRRIQAPANESLRKNVLASARKHAPAILWDELDEHSFPAALFLLADAERKREADLLQLFSPYLGTVADRGAAFLRCSCAMNQRQHGRLCTLEHVASVKNLFRAAAKARRGKSRRTDVEDWWLRRVIAAAPFRDRVVHHALCNVLAPVLERTFIARSYSCQVGKGTTAARECCRQLTNRFRYVLKCDVRKFFPNVDHEILLRKLAERVRCPHVLALIGRILGSFRTGEEVPAPLFPGDDLVAVSSRARGLPIGNLTSQLWANFYLDELDHWITEAERHGAYVRYTDDFLLFGDDKARLWDLRTGIVEQLVKGRLKLAEPKSRLLATREGVPFCGFRFLPGLRPRILGATKRRFETRRRCLVRAKDFSKLSRGLFAWYQFSREGNSEGLRRAYSRRIRKGRLRDRSLQPATSSMRLPQSKRCAAD
jgi:hypothetical protein